MSKRVIAYLRVSTDKQETESQRFGIENYCEEHGILIDQWVEDVISGSRDFSDRNFGEMWDSLKKGDTLILAELSRATRDTFGPMRILERCMKERINLISIKEDIVINDNTDINDVSVIMKIFIHGMSNHMEKVKISQRVKEGMARRKSQGFKMGRKKGSKTNPKKMKLFPHKQEIISMVKKRYKLEYIAYELGTNRVTLNKFMKDNNIKVVKK